MPRENRLVALVCFVHLVDLVQPNKRDTSNKQDKPQTKRTVSWRRTYLIGSYSTTEKGARWTDTSHFLVRIIHAASPAIAYSPLRQATICHQSCGFSIVGVPVSWPTTRFARRHLDIVGLHSSAIDWSPTLQESARVTRMFCLRGRGSALVLSIMSKGLAELGERPRRLLPVFHFLEAQTHLGEALQRVCGILCGFLNMFPCLSEQAHILERRPPFL